MYRQDVIAKLKEAEPVLRAQGVSGLFLFGSYARNEAGAGSDIDVFVDPESSEGFGFLSYMDVYEAIRKVIGDGIELGYSTREGLDDYIRADVEREAVRIF
jgi:predicted nucleotidyltransferase